MNFLISKQNMQSLQPISRHLLAYWQMASWHTESIYFITLLIHSSQFFFLSVSLYPIFFVFLFSFLLKYSLLFIPFFRLFLFSTLVSFLLTYISVRLLDFPAFFFLYSFSCFFLPSSSYSFFLSSVLSLFIYIVSASFLSTSMFVSPLLPFFNLFLLSYIFFVLSSFPRFFPSSFSAV
jgi:hypothetical protein